MDAPTKRAVIALYPYIRRAPSFAQYTLAQWVAAVRQPQELAWWQDLVLTAIHTVRLLTDHPAPCDDAVLLEVAPPDADAIARADTVRRFRALDNCFVSPILAYLVTVKCGGTPAPDVLPPYARRVADVACEAVRRRRVLRRLRVDQQRKGLAIALCALEAGVA